MQAYSLRLIYGRTKLSEHLSTKLVDDPLSQEWNHMKTYQFLSAES